MATTLDDDGRAHRGDVAIRQRILVAGATGVIGRRLLPALVASDHEVHGLARSEVAARRVSALGASPVRADVLDRDAVMRAMRDVRPTTVIHQATALPEGGANPRRLEREMAPTNRVRSEGTRNLVDAAERHGVQRLIAQSVAFAYRHEGPLVLDEDAPLDVDAPGGWGSVVRAIAALEEAVMGARQVQGIVLRYGGFYGPDTGLAADSPIARLARRRRLPVIGSGAGLTSFVHIDDAVGATLDALSRGWGIYNVVDDHPAPAREWVPAYAAWLGAPAPRRIPTWLARLLAGEHAVRAMTTQRGASNARAKRELGFKPEFPDWREGLRAQARAGAVREAA